MKKLKKRILALGLSLVMVLTLIPALGITALADEADAILVYVTVSFKGEIAEANDGSPMALKEVQVKDLDGNGAYSVDEALVAAHAAYNSEDGYAVAASSYGGKYVTKLWGESTSNTLFFVNDDPIKSDVETDTVSYGDCVTASVNADDAYYSDFYTSFDYPWIGVEKGEELTVTLYGFMGMAWMPEEEPIAGADLGYYKEDGTYVDLGVKTDQNGQATISFDLPGVYYLTAKGTIPGNVVTNWNIYSLASDGGAPYGYIDYYSEDMDSYVAYTEKDYGEGPYPADEVKYMDFFDWMDLEDDELENIHTLASNQFITDSPIIAPCSEVYVYYFYEGEKLFFSKTLDDEGIFGMWRPQEGTSAKLVGDEIVIHFVPNNKKTYVGFQWAGIEEVPTDESTQPDVDVAINSDGSFDFTVKAYFSGQGLPIAPIKKTYKDGSWTSAAQYYLALPYADNMFFPNTADNYTGIAQAASGAWFYLEDGAVMFGHTGVEQNKYGWWYVENGKINFDYTGFAKNQYGWWYIEKGQVNFKKTDILPGTAAVDPEAKGEDGWWYVEKGQVVDKTTVAQNAYGWWYVENGKVNFDYTGIKNNDYGWWRIEDGKVNFNFTGFASNENGWWYLEKGQVNFKKTGIIQGAANTDPEAEAEDGWWYVKKGMVTNADTVAQNAYGWWKIQNGKVNFEYTGLADNEYGWWYLKDGKVDFNYTGFSSNENGWWYVEKGQIKFNKNDVISGKANDLSTKEGIDGWWLVRKSKVTIETTVASNKYGWWYIHNGKVDFEYTGLAQNEYGTWYIKNGKVDFNFTGTVDGKKVVKGKVQ